MNMDFNERAIPGITSNFLLQEARARYIFAKKNIDALGLKKILDVACGVGYGSEILAKGGNRVFAIDIDEEAIEYAKRKYKSSTIKYRVSSAEKTPFKGRLFDAVVAFEMIEHLSNPDLFLIEMRRVLKRGGVMILSTPNAGRFGYSGIQSPFHEIEYNHLQIKRILLKHFKKVELYGQYHTVNAKNAYDDFLKSQQARQGMVNIDSLNIRGLLPRNTKEKLWRILGVFFGRHSQTRLNSSDFPIDKLNSGQANYLIAICKLPKPR